MVFHGFTQFSHIFHSFPIFFTQFSMVFPGRARARRVVGSASRSPAKSWRVAPRRPWRMTWTPRRPRERRRCSGRSRNAATRRTTGTTGGTTGLGFLGFLGDFFLGIFHVILHRWMYVYMYVYMYTYIYIYKMLMLMMGLLGFYTSIHVLVGLWFNEWKPSSEGSQTSKKNVIFQKKSPMKLERTVIGLAVWCFDTSSNWLNGAQYGLPL